MLLFDVPVPHEEVYLRVLLPEASGQFFRYGYGAVSAAGAAHAEGEIGLALRGVTGNEEGEKIVGPLQELPAVFGAKHRLSYGRVVAGERSELGVVVRVGEEADVE